MRQSVARGVRGHMCAWLVVVLMLPCPHRYTRASMSELTSMALQQFGPGIDDDELELFVETFQSLAVPVINEDRVFAMFNVGCGRKL